MTVAPDLHPPLPDLPAAPSGRYRHVKGGEYEVLGVVRHSETLEPLVLYRALSSSSGLWVRPHAMFFGQVLVDGAWRRRFEPLEGPLAPAARSPADPADGPQRP